MKIINMKKGDWGKIRAFFDIELAGFTLKGFKLVEGINGLFVGMPSQKGTDDNGQEKYYSTVYADEQTGKQLEKLAINIYQDVNSDMPDFNPEINQQFNN